MFEDGKHHSGRAGHAGGESGCGVVSDVFGCVGAGVERFVVGVDGEVDWSAFVFAVVLDEDAVTTRIREHLKKRLQPPALLACERRVASGTVSLLDDGGEEV